MDKDLIEPIINSVSLISNPYIRAATSENTRLAYRSDIHHFENWGGKLPSSSETIIHYLQEFADILNPRTLSRRIIAIKHWHTYQGFPDPTAQPSIQKTIVGIMRLNGWRAKAARKFKTINSNHKLPVAPNLLQQNFSASKPNEKWVSDITYVWTEESWLYLTVVMDLYSRMVVSWSMSDRMTSKLVIDSLQMAIWRRNKLRGMIIHSDRGSQYCSREYQQLLLENGFVCSMSKRGDCYDNASMESWTHSFKVEAIHGEKFSTRAIAKNHVFDYIDVYYNRKRLHSSLGYLSPLYFEAKKVA